MKPDSFKILAINPGGTSTKIALYNGSEEVFSEEIRHPKEEFGHLDSIVDELPHRLDASRDLLKKKNIDLTKLHAVAGRGGPFAPVPSGTFAVDKSLMMALEQGRYMVEHPSLLGAAMAFELAKESGCPAFIVDPVSVDEFADVSRITGLPEIARKSLSHALSIKSSLREAAEILRLKVEETNAVVLHLGSGFTVAASRRGRQIDCTDASASGPMAPTRTGTLPALDLLRLAFCGKYTLAELEKKLVGGGGWTAHLGIDDIREIYQRIDGGCEKSRLILDATFLQLAKETASMVAALNGKLDFIVITGGVARSERFVIELEKQISWLKANVVVLPGSNEMSALAQGAQRVLSGEIEALSIY